jgi:hypothetical protein
MFAFEKVSSTVRQKKEPSPFLYHLPQPIDAEIF